MERRPLEHRVRPWVPRITLVVVALAGAAAASLWRGAPIPGATARGGAASPNIASPNMESAGGPARLDPPSPSNAGPGASPLVSHAHARPAALVAPSLTFRSPLERSPGYYPPDDPESLSVLSGRREAPSVDGEFMGGAPTFDGLIEAALAALERADEKALHDLRVTRTEFERFLWRELPQSRPITNITAEDAWLFISTGSQAGAGRAASSLGGRRFAVLRVESSGPIPYTNFTLWRDVAVTLREEASGEIRKLGFLAAVVERNGRFKVFTYKD